MGSFKEDLDRVVDRICRGATCEDVRREGFPYPAVEWTTHPTQSWTIQPLWMHRRVQASKMPSYIAAATGRSHIAQLWFALLLACLELLCASVSHIVSGRHKIHLIGLVGYYEYGKCWERALFALSSVTVIASSLGGMSSGQALVPEEACGRGA